MNITEFDSIQYLGIPKQQSLSFLDITYKAWGWSGPVIWLSLHISLIIILVWMRWKMYKEGD